MWSLGLVGDFTQPLAKDFPAKSRRSLNQAALSRGTATGSGPASFMAANNGFAIS
jgi:hypothetical protein